MRERLDRDREVDALDRLAVRREVRAADPVPVRVHEPDRVDRATLQLLQVVEDDERGRIGLARREQRAARAAPLLEAGHVPSPSAMRDLRGDGGVFRALHVRDVELAERVQVQREQQHDRRRERPDAEPAAVRPERPHRLAPRGARQRRRQISRRGGQDALLERRGRLPHRDHVGQRVHDGRDLVELLAADRARRQVGCHPIGFTGSERPDGVELEVVADVLGHDRVPSSARRIFWRPMRMRPLTVPSGTPMSSASSTWV